ncbi:hypothetical protein [uncultured Helicobacter sp.]|uniref:hypothetical protein n=1 Tax=uncultured Helicobacter sp. TaxID=175537 RepID=UPI002638A776|nr:hypothetical protein [uncultured Helicobacter sp.]
MGLLNEILRILHLLNPTMQAQDIAALKREIIQKHLWHRYRCRCYRDSETPLLALNRRR